MTSEQWEEVKERFHQALEQPAEMRLEFLVQACSCNIVRLEVERLLVDHSRAGDFLNQPFMEPTKTLLAEPLESWKEFLNTPRFTVHERLGAGTFGVVYRVFDKERNSMVALKKMRRVDPAQLLRFKREFRSLVDLAHPNLLQLYELFGENRQWFFTMELVEGVDFICYVRPGDVLGNWDRLRDALFQLAIGVQVLHSSGRLHRDLKPSNVLVTADGRVVILDFGLVKEFESQPIEQSLALVGSPAYMAPEQASSGAIHEAADWYAVGVMLYKALTGQLPFTGTWTEVLERKQKECAPLSRDLAPDAPEDLNEACQCLLERKPELRSKGIAIVLAQERQSARKAKGADAYCESGREPTVARGGPRDAAPLSREFLERVDRVQEEFIGRRGELNLLRERFAALSYVNRQVVLVQGRSGIGKTSLVSHFLRGLKSEHPEAVILKGRCRESESVPYKALDPIADELVRYLRSLAEPVSTALLPRHPELLKRLFPVFGELGMFSAFPDRQWPDFDLQEIRRRAFEALSELLGRMTDRNPVVIWIDDLQWADLDSIAFIAELVLPTNAPALMLVLSFRSEEAGNSPPLVALQSLEEQLTDTGSLVDIEIGGLSESEGRDFLDLLQTEARTITEKQSREIVRESGGSPLLMSELLRFASREIEAGETRRQTEGVLISDMLRYRAGTLSYTARKLLEAVSVAGEPISKAILYRTVKTADEDTARATGLLIREHLLRATGGSQGAQVEPFHDQVREAALSWLSPAELRDWHADLAEVLKSEADTDPQRLLRHYRGAGNLTAAFEAALAAAKTAETALAFELAARFCADALETGEADEPAQASLHRRRAEALAKAGRGYESGQCYLQAADLPAHNDPVKMRRLAAEQLIRSGYLDEGTRLFADLLRGAGVHLPRRRIESLLRMLGLRAFIRFRGLQWRERAEAEVPAETVRKLDLLWSGAMALVSIDTISGSYLQALHMLAALRAGEPSRLALSLSFGAVYESMGGTLEYEHGRKLIGMAQQLAESLNDPYLVAVTYGCWAGLDFLSGRVEDGLSHSRIAVAGLNKVSRRGRAWELGTFNMVLIWFLGWGGRIGELSKTLPLIAEEGRSRGDIYTAVCLRCCGTSHLVELAADNPEHAMAEIVKSVKQWRETSYDLPHFYATFANVECLLYAGRAEEARQLLLSDWQAIRRSLFTRKSQIHRTILFYLRGRTALAGWQFRPDARELPIEIEQYAARLSKLGSPWGDALSSLLRAGVMAGRNRHPEALLLLQGAEEILRQQDLRLLAAAVLRRRGELEGKAAIDRVEAADAYMRSENILRPDRMTAMILPGGWL